MNNFAFCKYFPGNSVVHKMDSRLKIISSAMFFALAFSSKSIISLVLLAVFVTTAAIFSRVPVTKYIKSFKSVIIISFVTAFINLFFEVETSWVSLGRFSIPISGIKSSVLVFFRLFIMVFISSLIMFTTSPQEISAAFESILSPLKFLGVNIQEISMTITLSLRFIPVLFEETGKIINAQKVRGANFKSRNIIKKIKAYFNVFIPLFVFSFRRAANIALAMESRCYDASRKRTSFKHMNFKKSDVIAVAIILIIFIGVTICNKMKIF